MRKLFSVLLFACGSYAAQSQSLIISEFRLRGPNGANDEFIEVYNNSDAAITVAASDGSAGYAVAASNGVARFVIPNGTVIPARGHYLGVNSVGYSLASYPAGNGTTATGNATYTTDIPDNAGIALFKTAKAANFIMAYRLDAVGSTSEANTLYKEGAGYPAITPFSIDYTFYRKNLPGQPVDNNNNATDFKFECTNGTSAGAGQSLGAPGPENLSGPVNTGNGIVISRADASLPYTDAPNYVRDYTSDPANNSTFGTADYRIRITNNTGASLTRLRLRIVSLSTFPSPSGVADLRPRTSTNVVAAIGGANRTVNGTTLEQPPSQPNGGGFNSTLSVNGITLATPLAPNATVYVRLLLGIQQDGAHKFEIIPEVLPAGGAATYNVVGPPETSPLVISEFRLRGPNGANDEYIEIYNNGDKPVTVSATDFSAGYAVAASNGVVRFVIPNGTVIPARGHYLGVNSVGYSLASYPAGNGTTATGDATYTTDIPDNAGIALFSTANPANFSLAYRVDAVGATTEANTLYKEGAGYPAITPYSIDYNFHRKAYGGSITDRNDNAVDFKFECTNGTSAGAGQSLGAPSPQNLSSPIAVSGINITVVSTDLTPIAAPNFYRDMLSDPARNATFGKLEFRYRITNNTGSAITRLRLRIDSINTFPSPSGIADLRPITSTDVVVNIAGVGNVTARGTVLEQPASQPNGGGFNSTFSVGTITLATPLAAGASTDVRLVFGVQQHGDFRIALTPEANVSGPIVTNASSLKAFVSRANYTAAGDFYSNMTSAILPLSFTSFTAKEARGVVQLDWKVEEEAISSYEVYRASADMRFRQIGSMPSKGNGSANTYQFIDAQPATGTNFYKIIAIENGKQKYSTAIASINLKETAKVMAVIPRGNLVEVRLSNVERATYEVEIINMAGQSVYQSKLVNEGTSSLEIALPATLARGGYNLVLKNESALMSKTFVVQ